MHEAAARAHGTACEYRRFDLDELGVGVDGLADLVNTLERDGYAGFNVTHPCKQAVLPLLTDCSEDARHLGAVNTVVLGNGARYGHNTDWTGFCQAVTRGLPGATLDHVVQLGAGGAGAATAWALLTMGCRRLTLVDVIADRAQALAGRLSARFSGHVTAAPEPDDAMSTADGLVHATPMGMAAHPGTPIEAALLRPDLWVAEVVYVPLETDLLRAARRVGCRTVDGSGMALYQAVEAFRLFTGLEPDVERMRDAFLAAGRSE